MKKMIVIMVGLILFGLTACSSGDGADSDRLAALEVEVKALKLEAQNREKTFREELAQIRMNLEGIQDLLKVEKGRADVMDQPAPKAEGEDLDNELDTKAKSFVNENLDRLLAITSKLLDKMEKELDEQMKEMETPKAPEGDEI